MRKRSIVLLAAPVLVAVFTITAVTAASAAPPSNDPPTAAKYAASWLAEQVNAQGFIPQAADPTQANLSTSEQAVLALASAGVGRSQVDALESYLGAHVDDAVVKSGSDDAGSLAYLILGAVAAGNDPTSFGSGHVDLVTRLQATKQSNGLFGASDPTYDGAFRQGLALMALKVAGATDSAATDWLAGQQCANGLWTAYRADTTTPCPAVDPTTFAGPDTNSTALAVLGLLAQGRTAPADAGANALRTVRNSGGGWGFLARSDQSTDANSTGLVVSALRADSGSQDAAGTAALLALQVGCDGDPADAGGVAFQDSPTGLVPDELATAEAAPALANVVLPLGATTIADQLTTCASAAPTTTAPASTTTPAGTAAPTAPSSPVAGRPLARTGSSASGETGVGVVLLVGGVALVQAAQIRRRRQSARS